MLYPDLISICNSLKTNNFSDYTFLYPDSHFCIPT